MTTLQHTPTSSTDRLHAEFAPPVGLETLREQSTVCLAWNICPRALRAAAPEKFAALSDGGVKLPSIALDLQIDLRAKTAQALLRAAHPHGPRTHSLGPLALLTLTPDSLSSLLHLDASSLLRATLALDDRARITGVVYAATPILAALGLPGGMCDAPTLE